SEDRRSQDDEMASEEKLVLKLRRLLTRRSYRSRAGLRADAVPALDWSQRASFHHDFERAVRRLEADGTIDGWPTSVEWHRKQVSRGAILRAIAEFDRNGRAETLARHGFRRALDYVILYEGKEYDSKALYAIAYGLEYPDDPPLRDRAGFSGGLTITRKLEREGFRIKRLRSQADAALKREGARAWIVRAGRNGENEDLEI